MSQVVPLANLTKWFYAILALVAFAGNSVLCRLALADQSIDPISFTSVRLISGAAALMVILMVLRSPRHNAKQTGQANGSWWGAACLFAYAVLFSIAYVALDTATGALILFGSVQFSIIGISIFSGGSLRKIECLGALIASFGLAYLLWPELSEPSIWSAAMMMIAGVAWGCYTLNGRGSKNALRDTAFNFLRCAPLVIVMVIPLWGTLVLSTQGVLLAIASGAVTSGLGYAVWYATLPSLGAVQSGVIQLLVPTLAAAGGALLVGESITVRLTIASVLILGGILLTLVRKSD